MAFLIRIFDILASFLTILSLNLVIKSYKYWLMYILATVLFIIVCIYNKIPGLSLMGISLLITGIRNYYIGRKSDK